jgi:hypothetical protein
MTFGFEAELFATIPGGVTANCSLLNILGTTRQKRH